MLVLNEQCTEFIVLMHNEDEIGSLVVFLAQ